MSDAYYPPPPPPPPVQPYAVDKASGMAITALIFGILSFCCCGFIAGIPALVLGFMENGKINRGASSAKGKWMAIVAIVLGIISVVMGCIQIIWVFFFGGMQVLQGMMQR